MAFIKNKIIKIGDKVITTKKHENFAGYMEIGTEVTVIDINERGYNIQDNEGNKIYEIGWVI